MAIKICKTYAPIWVS